MDVAEKTGKVLVKCHAACAQDAVIDALRRLGLWSSAPQRDGRRPAPAVKRWELRDERGEVVAIHCRQDCSDGKRMWWELPDGTKGLGGRRVETLPLYGAERLAELPDGAVVIVTEGEKAAEALRAIGVEAVATVTGASVAPNSDALRPLARLAAYLWADADPPGEPLMESIARRLHGLGAAARLMRWPDAPDKGDAADFIAQGETAEAVRALIDAAEPWEPPKAEDGAALLDDLVAFIRRYVVATDAQAEAIALWLMHTHTIDAADATPYLSIRSAEKRSGKTRLLETLELLVARPWLTGRVSAAALVRKIERDKPTLLLDEMDAAFRGEKDYAEALRGILKNGHRLGGVASLCVGQGANLDVRDFSVFGPKAIASIGKLPDTVCDRSITITLKRRAPSERVARFRRREVAALAAPLRGRLEDWAASHIDTLRDARPEIPDALDDRAQDGWEPLLAVADLAAGGCWPEKARAAALALSVGADREDDSLGVRLLADIRAIFAERGMERLHSAELVSALLAIEESPWGDLPDKQQLDTRRLARLLRPYGSGDRPLKPRNVRYDGTQAKGYEHADFLDAFGRYLPPEIVPSVPSVPQNRIYGTDGTDGTAHTECKHRREGEAEQLWGMGEATWAADAKVCACCGAPTRSGLAYDADCLCPPCRADTIAPHRGGHLVRLALDLGGPLVSPAAS